MLSQFELEVLSWVAADYESVHTIHKDLEHSLGRTISEEEILSTLNNLVQADMVDVYEFKAKTNLYEKISTVKQIRVKEPWFMANNKGRSNL